jgi:hypothetical protein
VVDCALAAIAIAAENRSVKRNLVYLIIMLLYSCV